MDIFNSIENSEDFNFFLKNANAISHSILLISKDEKYSMLFAKLLSCLILDKKIDKNSLNYQKIMFESHPDVLYFPKKEKLLVADSQEIVAESFVKPVFANRKIFIIKNIDSSMESAQNKLLKTLEEPSSEVYIISTCTNQNLVLPTIKSRCQKIELAKLPDEQIKKIIEASPNCNLVVSLCDGQLGKAVDLSKKNDLQEMVTLAVNVFTKMLKSNQVLEYSKKIQEFATEKELLLEIMQIVIEDLLKIKVNKLESLKLKNFQNELVDSSSNYTVRALCKIVEVINKFQKEIFYNSNYVLALENMLLNILEVKFLCK